MAATCSFGGFAYWPLPAERADVLHRIVRGRVGSAHALPTARYVAVGHVAYPADLRDPDAYPGELLRVPASGGCSPPLVPALGCAWDLVEVPRSGGGILRQVRLRAKGLVRHSLLKLGP